MTADRFTATLRDWLRLDRRRRRRVAELITAGSDLVAELETLCDAEYGPYGTASARTAINRWERAVTDYEADR